MICYSHIYQELRDSNFHTRTASLIIEPKAVDYGNGEEAQVTWRSGLFVRFRCEVRLTRSELAAILVLTGLFLWIFELNNCLY